MKKNFKVLGLAAIMFAAISCSKDQGTINNGSVNGAETRALITLSQTGVATRVASATPTNDEKAIKNATLYIFNASQSLESTVTFAAGEMTTGKEIKTSTGNHYFLLAVNTPGSVVANATVLGSIVTGEHISAVSAMIMEAASMADLTTPTATGDGFFMTNTGTPTAHNLAAGGTAGSIPVGNTIQINIGRAMVKVSVEVSPTVVQAKGPLSSVQYLVANNPVKMNMFPVFSGTQLQTPLFTTAHATTNYFPLLSAVAVNDFKNADGNTAFYAMENANATPTQGNATMVLVKGVFTPSVWYDNTGAVDNTPAVAGNDFYRIGIKNASGVVDNYLNKIYSSTLTQAQIDTESANNANALLVKYTDGVCYYPLYLADDAQGANIVAKRTVKRNSYFYVTINSIDGPGSSTTDGVVTDPDKPLETDTYIKAEISILPWTVITQNGNI